MQYREQPQTMLWKIAFLIIALGGNVSCIRNGNGNDEQKYISSKLKIFFPSEPLPEAAKPVQSFPRVTNGGSDFRPSQMLEFTSSDVMQGSVSRYPPSYLEPNYKHQVPSSLSNLNVQQSVMDRQLSFPEPSQTTYHNFDSTQQIPTTPVVSYLDPFTQQNYRYTPAPTTSSYIQYQHEQPAEEKDQVYTVQSSLLVGNHSPQLQQQQQSRPGEVYLKRPGYVFDESPMTLYRRPEATTSTTTATPGHKISYDSHDYPPPSYAAQKTSNFVPHPQPRPRPTTLPPYNRQDVNDNRPLAGGSSIHPQYSTSSNYANNFGNYLQRPPIYSTNPNHKLNLNPNPSPINSNPNQYQYEPFVRPQKQQKRPEHNYYEYQIGEIPPQQYNYRPVVKPSYRPGPPTQSTGSPDAGGFGGVGLATLASLFSSTQQYAPQFTNLLLGGTAVGGSSSPSSSSYSSGSPLGSLLGAFAGTGQHQQQQSGRPPSTQLIRALENIARNDDLQCVPKVLCQMIAGQTLRGQLPGFITSPAITNFLAGFPAASPALIYGRAALLGISGGERSCVQSYESCPKNEMEIIHYLNNHRGGFFKFFSEPEEQPAEPQSPSSGGSLLSILSALTGGGQEQGLGQGLGQVTRTTQRPVVVARPTQRPSTNIAEGIGSFFNRVLSDYLSGVELQRRRRRRSLLPTEIKCKIQTDNSRLMPVDFHDEEDNLDTQTPVKFQDDDEAEAAQAHTDLIGVLQFPEEQTEGRILHFKNIESDEQQDGAVRFPDATAEVQVIYDFNRNEAQRKLRFPQEHDENERQAKKLVLAQGWAAVLPNELGIEDYSVGKKREKRIVFRDTNAEHEEKKDRLREEQFREEGELKELQLKEEQREPQYEPPNAVYKQAAPPQRGARVIFPDHYERHIRKGKILNRPTYAPSFEYDGKGDAKEDRLIVSEQRPASEQRPGSYYRLETTDYQTQALSHGFMNYGEYLPGNTVRFVESNDEPQYNAHYNYPNANYISNNRYSSAYQTTSTKRPKHKDDKNIYVTNSHGITEYYIRPDGQKVFLGSV